MMQSSLSTLMLGDESYARNTWYFAFLDALRDLVERGSTPKKAFLLIMDPELTHQTFRKEFMIDPKINESTLINYN